VRVRTRIRSRRAQGVLSFTAPPGTVALPPHTAACLAAPPIPADADAEDAPSAGAPPAELPLYSGPLRVRYTRLPKGTFAALQPLAAAFQRDVPDIKAALEEALAQHSTLSVGDVIAAVHGGARHVMRVTQLAPADAVSVIHTGAALREKRNEKGRGLKGPMGVFVSVCVLTWQNCVCRRFGGAH
jgi:hypothetical protein